MEENRIGNVIKHEDRYEWDIICQDEKMEMSKYEVNENLLVEDSHDIFLSIKTIVIYVPLYKKIIITTYASYIYIYIYI